MIGKCSTTVLPSRALVIVVYLTIWKDAILLNYKTFFLFAARAKSKKPLKYFLFLTHIFSLIFEIM